MKKVVSLVTLFAVVLIFFTGCQTRYIPIFAVDTMGWPYFTVQKLPTKELGGETTLEFWVGEYVTERDFKDHAKVYGGYLGEGYELDDEGYIASEHYVKYRIDNYPHVLALRQGILEIEVTDPEVKIYGLTTESSLDEFVELFESLGATYVTKHTTTASAKIGNAWFKLYKPNKGPAEFSISTQATGVVIID